MCLVLEKLRKRTTDMKKKSLDTVVRWKKEKSKPVDWTISSWKTARNIGFEPVLTQSAEARKNQPDCNFYCKYNYKFKNGEYSYCPNDTKCFIEKNLGLVAFS